MKLVWLLMFALGCSQVDARQLYRRGMLRYQLGQYQQAIDDLTEAWQISGEPVLLYDLAQAYRRKREPGAALRLYRSYLRLVPGAHNRQEVKHRIAELQAHGR